MSRTPGLVTSLLLSLAPFGCAGGSASLSTETGASVDANAPEQAANAEGASKDEAKPASSDTAAKGPAGGSPERADEEYRRAADAVAPRPYRGARRSSLSAASYSPRTQSKRPMSSWLPLCRDCQRAGCGGISIPHEPAGADTARETLRGAEAPQNPLDVAFVVGQRGADLPWTLVIANRGNRPLELAADVRLLELEVQKPAPPEPEGEDAKKKAKPAKVEKPTICKVSASERPKQVEPRLAAELPAASMAVYRFDPRLICDEEVLVPGATVTPRFGWEPKTKTVWKAGKKEEIPVEQEAPFVVRAEQAENAPEPLKQLVGEPFTLDASYAPQEEPAKTDSKEPPPLELFVRPLGSAKDARTETVTVEIKNPASVGRYIFVRRELITYEVVGPAGNTSCIVYPDQRAPTRQAFEFLSPGRTISLTSRLPEMCPPGTFDTSGLYRVHARFDAVDSGEEYNLNAYTGVVASKKPGILRMRGGEPPHMFVVPVQPPAH